MAELEVVKHTKAVYNIMKNPQTGWKHKLKETLIEIGIIVFAITLSLWLHNWSEHNHVKQEEREFLIGLQIDMQKDLTELGGDVKTYRNVKKGFDYFYNVAYGSPLQQDSLKQYKWVMYNTTHFNSNNSRYEGLKASGKLGIIENKKLLNNILELYQEDIPWLNLLNADMNDYKREKLEPAINTFLIQDKNNNGNWEHVLREPQIQNNLRHSASLNEIMAKYDSVIEKYNKTLVLIAEEVNQ
ncbi:hypothetical protein H8S95_09575 [Pontibacter sp. KCTC 32443]|uniref:hypothetical protein n=1 Tax=Pontibacter TaxID=323449 RepID=UPI00164DBE86|nr:MULTISPECIES: hypothetical protein [Pontibacter]MBC5774309.1 hypothetical protein [Pontibacter sp. KCTC 32443]